MEKFKSYKEKYTPEQIERFNKVMAENDLIDEDPDNFVIHSGEKIIRIAKKEAIDLAMDNKRVMGVPIEEAVKAICKYPDLPFSEALKKSREE